MARTQNQNGLGNLLGLGVIMLILGSVIYSVWGASEPPKEQPIEQPQVVQQEQPKSNIGKVIEDWGIGDGKLGTAQTLSASDLGKATPISGGGLSGFGGGGGSTSTTRTASSSTTTTPPRSGG